MLRIRGASSRDIHDIDKMLAKYNFPNFDIHHIEMLVVIEEDEEDRIIAVASLTTLLEATFITDKEVDRKTRVEALRLALNTAKTSVDQLGYNSYVVSVKDELVAKTLKQKFEFQDAVKTLISFVR